MLLLETERLLLQHFTPDDDAFILELLNTPGWLQYIGDRGIHSLEDARNYLQTVLIPGYEQNGYGFYMVRQKTTGTPMGMCGLVKRAVLPATDIGFAFLPEFMGQGFALEAATAVADYARHTIGLPYLLAITLPQNASSIRLLQKIGLHFEKTIQMAGEELLLFTSAVPE